MKQVRKCTAFVLSIILLLSLFSVPGLAAARDGSKNQVRVIVENTTYAVDDGAPWAGTLLDTWVDIDDSSTMMSCIVAALDEGSYTQTGADSGYISEINGLNAFDGGSGSGWMGTLNDWFTDKGFHEFKVANGDVIRIMYTCDMGEDIGGGWGETDKTLKSLAVQQEATAADEDVVIALDSDQTAKVYAVADDMKVTELLGGSTPSGGRYSARLPAGDYRLEVYEGDRLLGALKMVVTSDGPTGLGDMDERNHFAVYSLRGISVANSGWTEDADYSLSASVCNNSHTFYRDAEFGTDADGKRSLVCFSGDTITVTYTPNTTAHPDFVGVSESITMTKNEDVEPPTLAEGAAVTFVVPKGAKVDAGLFHDYYIFDFLSAVSSNLTDGETDSYTFGLPRNKDCFYRVQPANGETYWNYGKWSAATTVTVTASELENASGKDDVHVNDIYLNINEKNYIDLAVGETKTLEVFRNWFAIESTSNAKCVVPDFHYQVIGTDGQASDVLTVTPDEKNSGHATLKAEKKGTAIVLVTYDAMNYPLGMSGTRFAAIDPERTGVFVVSVGADGSGIAVNMTINEGKNTAVGKVTVDALDAEHDILFFVGDEGASYSFKPESGCTVTVARSTVSGGKLSFSGFTSTGVSEKDGTFTVSDLTTGRHIIRVEKEGLAAYQVITAQQVSYKLMNKGFTEEIVSAMPGMEVGIQFAGLTQPAAKLNGVYNFNEKPYYKGSDVAEYGTATGGFGNYTFNSDAAQQRVTVKIPDDYSGEAYTLTEGSLHVCGFGSPAGLHRENSYVTGRSPNFSAPSQDIYLAQLPDLSIPVAQKISADCAVKDSTGKPLGSYTLSITLEDSAVTVEAGKFTAYTGATYQYAATADGCARKLGSFTVPVDAKTYSAEIILDELTDEMWDGSSTTKPAMADDIYQIGTGVELAWFASEVNGGQKTISAVLTDDIDLAGFDWTPIGNTYAGTFDGSGHSIRGLYINSTSASQGLFGQVGAATIKNLAVYGSVTSTGKGVGGIVGTATKTFAIENCANFASVSGKQNVGGIVGSMAATASILNCYNAGTITASSSLGGGISGGFTTAAMKNVITGSYNIGTVVCPKNGGALTASTATAGITNSYYLSGSFGDTSKCGTEMTAAEMKTADFVTALGEAFKADTNFVNDGYPLLKWQSEAPEKTGWDGSGTADDPYLLKKVADVQLLSQLSAEETFAGTYFKFDRDITLPTGWTPIGTTGKRFGGTIDGDGHLLTVPAGEKALLGATENAALKNLNIYGESINGNGVVSIYTTGSTKTCITIENVTLKSGTKTTGSGFISGYASGSHPVIIRGCTVEAGVEIGDGTANNIGSFGGDFNGTVIGCVSHATVKGVNYVGGICGSKGQTMGDYVIIDCIFDGTVEAGGECVGGISGSGYAGTSFGLASAPNTPCATILNCLCSGSITGSDKVGGILGAEPGVKECWNNGVGYIQSNLFTGTVAATGENPSVGGIVGYLSSLNNAMVISDNYYLDTAAAKGIGMIEMVETPESSGSFGSSFNEYTLSGAKYGRTDDPVGADADKLTKAVTAAGLTDGTVLAKLNGGMNSSGIWTQGTGYPVFTACGEKHLVRIACSELNTSGGMSQILGEDVLEGKTLTLQYSDGSTDTLSASDASVVKEYAPTAAHFGKYIPATITVQGHQLEFNLLIKAPAPNIKKGASDTASAYIGQPVTVNLKNIFEDANDLDMTYTAKLPGTKKYVDIETTDGVYTYPQTPSEAGELTFSFKASNVSSSSGVFTLTVNVLNNPAADAVVYLTVSNQGVPATANDGSVMAYKPVTVTDINSDGKLTFDEALTAAHEAYNSAAGYAVADSDYGLSVTKLWGESTMNTLFFINNESLLGDVGTDMVTSGDHLVASVNADNVYYADWYSFFDKRTDTTTVGGNITLTLKGHLGMAWTDEDKTNVGLAGITVKTVGGTVLGTTDANGSVTFSFTAAGTYIVTANGTVKNTVDTDWDNVPDTEADCPIIAPVCVVTVSEKQVVPVSTDITVYFTLMGDTKHDTPTAATGTHTLRRGNLTTWVAKKAYTVEENSTVWDLLKQVVSKTSGLSFANESGNYVSAITYNNITLGEFDNGALSGWMYTLNGRHPDKGVAEQRLSDGDVIVFHYTDDYTKEQGSDNWNDDSDSGSSSGSGSGSSSGGKQESSTTESETAKTGEGQSEVAVETKVESGSISGEVTAVNGEAALSLKSEDVTAAIAAITADFEQKTLEIKPTVSGESSSVSVSLPAAVLSEITGSEITVDIVTEDAAITIPADTLSEIASQGEGDVKIEVRKADTAAIADRVEPGLLENATVVEINITVGERSVTQFGGSIVTLSIPVSAEGRKENGVYPVIAVSDDGSVDYMVGTLVIRDGVYTLEVSSGHLSKFAVLEQETVRFSDVKTGSYYESAVNWAVLKGITVGTGADSFSPEATCTRAQMVTFLWRALGKPEVETSDCGFADVAEDSYYAAAVRWAAEQGVTSGVDETHFAPDAVCQRGQMAAFLYRCSKAEPVEGTNPFTDVEADSVFAPAILWAAENGIAKGITESAFAPTEPCTRGQIVTFLYRWLVG